MIARFEAVQEGLFYFHFRHTSIGETPHESGPANIGIINFEAESRGQDHPKWHHNAQKIPASRRLEDKNSHLDLIPILGSHTLKQDALLTGSPRRGLTPQGPIAKRPANGRISLGDGCNSQDHDRTNDHP
jgi:hypothetical protein